MKRALFSAGLGFVAALMLAGVVWKVTSGRAVSFDTPYQAVMLDNGQVYFGRMKGLSSAFPVLTEVYYVQEQLDPETKKVKNVLVRRGSEWHAPNRMVMNSRHIVLVEPVTPGSTLAKLIEELNRKK
ncbi:MAG TPA: hypothetical protein VKO18_09515 [Terriglobia bacterium]|nr:hypothetical protein [Terriglobia bacterium]